MEEFADIVEVDPKTVQRWLSGRYPHARNRAMIARALDRPEQELWPNETPPAPQREAPVQSGGEGTHDVIGSTAFADDQHAPSPVGLVAAATAAVEVIDGDGRLLSDAAMVRALIAAADAGLSVRVLAYFPGRDATPLIAHPGIEVRVGEGGRDVTVVRSGEEMLATFELSGEGDAPRPLLALRRQTGGGLFDRLIDWQQKTWAATTETLATAEQFERYLIDTMADADAEALDDLRSAVDDDDRDGADEVALESGAHRPPPLSGGSSSDRVRRWPGRRG